MNLWDFSEKEWKETVKEVRKVRCEGKFFFSLCPIQILIQGFGDMSYHYMELRLSPRSYYRLIRGCRQSVVNSNNFAVLERQYAEGTCLTLSSLYHPSLAFPPPKVQNSNSYLSDIARTKGGVVWSEYYLCVGYWDNRRYGFYDRNIFVIIKDDEFCPTFNTPLSHH